MLFIRIYNPPWLILSEDTGIIPDSLVGILDLLGEIIPLLYTVALITTNIALILGGLIYLLDSRDENGKEMVFRSLICNIIFIFIFDGTISTNSIFSSQIAGIEKLGSFILLYLLYSFAALSIIMLVTNCGIYLINPTPKTVTGIKKSIICIFAVLLPLGFNFPSLPTWRF